MRRLAMGLALLMLVAYLPASQGASSTGVASGWSELLTIDTAHAHPAKMFEAFDTASLNLYDFNGDGQLEIVSNNDNNRFYVLDSRTGGVLFEGPTSHPGGESWPVRDLNPIAIGDLMGDGDPCMVVPSDAAKITAWCYNPALSTPTKFNFTKMWDVTINAEVYEPGFREAHPWLYYPGNNTHLPQFDVGSDGDAFMASVDDTGCKYVFVETDGWPGQLAFDCHGAYKWSVSYYDGNAGATVIDLDHDGKPDACFASDAGEIACYDAKTGHIKWTFRAREHNVYPGSVPLAPAFADVYGDGKLYTFYGARNAVYNATRTEPPKNTAPDYDANWMNETHAMWFLVDPHGQMVWNVSYDWMNPVQYNHPAAIDVNGDGVLDFVALDWNTIGHKPGDWEPTNRSSNLFALDGRDGSVIWHVGVPIYWSNKDFVIADADGDGKQDIIAAVPHAGVDGLAIYDLANGHEKGWFPFNDGWGTNRGPVAGDLYGDGKLEIVIPATHRMSTPNYRSLDVGYREGELHVIGTGQPWNAKFSANIVLNDEAASTVHGSSGGATKPGAPQGLSATPTTDGATLSWSAPVSNGGAGISGYHVYRSSAGGAPQLVATATTTTWTDTGVPAGTFTYAVAAVNSVGEGPKASIDATIAPAAPPPVTSTPGTPPATSTPPASSSPPATSTPVTSAPATSSPPPSNGSANESSTPARVPSVGAPLVAAAVAAGALAWRRKR